MASDFKDNILAHLETMLKAKEATYLSELANLKADLNSASKSSAGDKHETGRAMVHLEQEKLGKQLLSTQKDLKTLQLMKGHAGSQKGPGTLIVTENNYFLLGLGLGMIQVDEKNVVCVSMLSPVAQKLILLGIGDQFNFGKNSETVKDIIS